MDQAFRDAMASGYRLTEPGLVIGSPMHDCEVLNEARVQVARAPTNGSPDGSRPHARRPPRRPRAIGWSRPPRMD